MRGADHEDARNSHRNVLHLAEAYNPLTLDKFILIEQFDWEDLIVC